MLETLQKLFLAGIGTTAFTVEKIESSMKELVDKGKISAEEARQTAGKIVEEVRHEYEQARVDLHDSYQNVLKKADLVTRAELKVLEQRVATLETRLNAASGNPDSHA